MNSTISFTVWKSTRKNAKVEMIDILHFEDVSQERDIEKIVNATAKSIDINGHTVILGKDNIYRYYGGARLWEAQTLEEIKKCIDTDYKILSLAYP